MTTLGVSESSLQSKREGSFKINVYWLFCEADSKLDAFAPVILFHLYNSSTKKEKVMFPIWTQEH